MAAVWYVSHICVTKPEARGESKRDGNNMEYGGPAGVQAWGLGKEIVGRITENRDI